MPNQENAQPATIIQKHALDPSNNNILPLEGALVPLNQPNPPEPEQITNFDILNMLNDLDDDDDDVTDQPTKMVLAVTSATKHHQGRCHEEK